MNDSRMAKLRAFLANDPSDSFAQYALALEYASLGEKATAVTLLETLVARDNRYVAAYQQLGYLYQELDRSHDARSILSTGMEVADRENDLHARREMQDALDALNET